MSNAPTMNASNPSEIEEILTRKTRIDRPIFLDSKPYTPYKWSVFFIYSAIIGASLWLLYRNFIVGDIPPFGILNFFLFAAYVGVFLGLPFATFYLLNLLFPIKLLVDKVGVTMCGWGKEKRLKWTDIESITIEEELIRKKTVFRIKINSKHGSLKWGYYLGVDPTVLKNFLVLQRGLFAPDQNV